MSLFPPNGRVFPVSDSLTPVLLGAGVFGTDYNTPDTLDSNVPAETLRLAFRYGINGLDTSPYYTCSEQVLGKAFQDIKDEFPRSSYFIITKAGRYGRTKADFDYSPDRIRRSVEESCQKMGTDYIDGLYMHDVEFISEQVGRAGLEGLKVNEKGGLDEQLLKEMGLGPEDTAVIRGPGDETVLKAMETLLELKREGKIRWVGFSGYPLPTLLRLARLVAHHLEPVDIVQTYSHHCLQNVSLTAYLPLFYRAGVKQVMSASPLSMGLLRDEAPPAWHPASATIKEATIQAAKLVKDHVPGKSLQDVALGYGLKTALLPHDVGRDTISVIGLSNPKEVHAMMKVYLSMNDESDAKLQELVKDTFRARKTLNVTWASGI